MIIDIKNKQALVTGASRGIGKSIAYKLAKAGAYIIGTATSEEGINSINNFIQENNFKGCGAILNCQKKYRNEHLKELKSKFNPSIIVNNAGIVDDHILLRLDNQQIENVIDVNLISTIDICKTFISSMIKEKWGRIINISSIVSKAGSAGQTNYAASKGGIEAFSRSLAKELARRNITVNTVSPGYIKTDMTNNLPQAHHLKIIENIPMYRQGQPEEVANLVVFLASNEASYITAQTIGINGGMLAS